MKKYKTKIIMTLFLIIIIAFSVNAQEKTLKEIDTNYYAYLENDIDDSTHQKGFYKKVEDELIRDGKWKLYINGELKTEAIYEDDEIILLIVEGVRYSSKDLYIKKLERKVERLIADK